MVSVKVKPSLTVLAIILVMVVAGSGALGAPPAGSTRPVVIVQGIDVPTLDPQFTEAGNFGNLQHHLFDFLVSYNKSLEIVPDAAESFRLLPDRVTWQFKIRRGIKFWNGEVLDAKAVKFTFDRIVNPELRKQGLNDPYYDRVDLAKVDIVDDYTVNFVLKKPNILFLVYTTFNPILAPGYYSKATIGEAAIKPMGSGPWMFKEWKKDEHITMVANPNYWRGRPQIDTLIWGAVPETSTRLAMLQTGAADIVADLAPEDVAKVEADKYLRICRATGARRVHIGIPTQNPLFKDRRVRQAFNYAVDFDAINKALLNGLASGRMTVPVNGDFWVDPNIRPYAYDPARAQSLLREAGWNPNTPITIFSPVGRYMKDKEMAQAVAGYLQRVGVRADVQTLEWSVYSSRSRRSEFTMPWLIGWGSRFFGPEDLAIIFEPGFEGFEWVDNTENGPQAKRLYSELTGTFDVNRQRELVHQISRLFVDEAPWIFLWKQASVFGVNRRLNWNCFMDYRIYFWLPGDQDVRLMTTQ
jgi:peptide/nickel transport system substrate-binding protein